MIKGIDGNKLGKLGKDVDGKGLFRDERAEACLLGRGIFVVDPV